MPYVTLDDGFHSNPKIVAVGLDGAGLYARALSYCGDYLTDGFVPEAWVKEAVGMNRKCVKKLLMYKLFVSIKGGFSIPDYLTYNDSKEQVIERRKKKSKAGQTGARSRWGNGTSHGTSQADAMANAWQTDSNSDSKTMATRARAALTTNLKDKSPSTEAKREASYEGSTEHVTDYGDLRHGDAGTVETIEETVRQELDKLKSEEVPF